MSIKSLIQIFILITIFSILGVVYWKYFSKERIAVSQSIKIENNKIEKKSQKDDEQLNVSIKKEKIKKKNKSQNKKKTNEEKYSNLVKEIEYITIDKNGNNYKIIAKEGFVNKDSLNILTLKSVKGEITSKKRAKIIIEADKAEYNSTNLNTKFSKNIVMKYENKLIRCENLDINMENNKAKAYKELIIIDEQSKLKASIIVIDLLSGEIKINPTND